MLVEDGNKLYLRSNNNSPGKLVLEVEKKKRKLVQKILCLQRIGSGTKNLW